MPLEKKCITGAKPWTPRINASREGQEQTVRDQSPRSYARRRGSAVAFGNVGSDERQNTNAIQEANMPHVVRPEQSHV